MIGYILAGIATMAILGKTTTVSTKTLGVAGNRLDFASRFLTAAAKVNLNGIPPKFLLAMSSLETGWGSGRIFVSTNNLFSITAGSKWTGPIFKASTGLKFRIYNSLEESIADFISLIKSSKRYSGALNAAIQNNAEKFYTELQKNGYAGDDTKYASKILKTLEAIG